MAHGNVTIDFVGNNSQLKRELTRTERIMRSFARRVTQVFVGVGLVILARKFFALSNQIAEAYKKQITAEAKLGAAVKATGAAAGFSEGQLKDYAVILQEMTGVADDMIISMLAVLSTFKNIRGDVFKDASKAILDMSVALEVDLKTAAIQVGKALNDPIKGMAALKRVGVSFTRQQEEQVKAMLASNDAIGAQRVILAELEGEFGGTAEAVAKNTLGYTKLFNRLGDVSERIVTLLMPAFEVVGKAFDNLVTLLENSTTSFEKYNSAISTSGVVLSTVYAVALNKVVDDTSQSVAIVLNSWDFLKVGTQLATASITLGVVKMANTVKHYLTAVIPQYLTWLAENWVNVLENLSGATDTIVSNMWDNLINFMTSIASRLQGGKDQFVWKGLLEGFESTLTELPKIAKREAGGVESIMQTMVDNLKTKLTGLQISTFLKGKSFSDKFKDMFLNREPLPKDPKPDPNTKPPVIEGEKQKPPKAPKEPKKPKEPKEPKQPKEPKEPKPDTEKSTGTDDLISLNQRIMDAAARRQDPVVKGVNKLADLQKGLPKKIGLAVATAIVPALAPALGPNIVPLVSAAVDAMKGADKVETKQKPEAQGKPDISPINSINKVMGALINKFSMSDQEVTNKPGISTQNILSMLASYLEKSPVNGAQSAADKVANNPKAKDTELSSRAMTKSASSRHSARLKQGDKLVAAVNRVNESVKNLNIGLG